MAASGGDILEITFNHPTLGSGTLYPKSGEDGTIKLGGFQTNDDANQIDGSGSAIKQMNQTRWSLGTTCSWDQNDIDEVQLMNDLSGDPEEADWTITFINGVVRGGKGSPVGEIEGNSNAATFELNIAGGGRLKKIVG